MAKVSKTGYMRNSKDKNEPALVIPSNNITMRDVDFPVFGIDDMGNSQMMYPGMNYNFPGSFVYEIPMAQSGGDISIPDLSNKGWLSKYQDGGIKTFGSRLEYIDEPAGMRVREKGTEEWRELDSSKAQVLKNLMAKFVPKENEPQDYVDQWLSSLGAPQKPATTKPTAKKPIEEPTSLVERPALAQAAPGLYSVMSGVDLPEVKEIEKKREINKYAASPEFRLTPYKDEDEAVNAYKQTADFNLRHKNVSDYTPDDITKVQSYLDQAGYYPETKRLIKVEDYQTPEQVIELQKYLANEGLLEVLGVTGENIDGNLSGKIDKQTLEAIRQYNMYNQKYNSGQLDNNTKDAIRAYKNKIDAKSTLGISVRSPFELYDPQTGKPDVALTNESMQEFEKQLMKRGFFTGNVKYDFTLKPSDVKIGYNFSINPDHDYDKTEDAKVKGQVVRGCAQYVNGTVCSEDVVGEEAREELGFKGDAWTLSENLQSKGGKLLFTGLPERSQVPLSPKAGEDEIKNYLKSTLDNDAVKGQLREMLNTGNIKPGDVVNIFYEGSPSTKKAWNQTQPLNNRFFTTHVGIVKADKNGKLYVEHNVHGDLQKQPVEDFIEGKVPGNSKNQVSLIAGITRPNYFDGVDNEGRIPAGGISYYQTEYGQFKPEGALANKEDWAAKSISGENTHKFLSVIEKNKKSILKDIPITENEFGKLMRVARVIPTLETYSGKNYEKSVMSNVMPYTGIAAGVAADVIAKGLQDTFMPEREKSMGITSLKDETNINAQLRSKLYESDYELADPVKAGIPTFYVLSKNYLYLKEVANEYGLDMTSDQLAKLAGISYNQSIGKVAAELIEKGGYDNYIKYRRDTASKGEGKFQYHKVVDLYDKQTMKTGGWLKKYQGNEGPSQVNPELAKFMKQKPQDDLRAVNLNVAPAVSTSVTIRKPKGNPLDENQAVANITAAKFDLRGKAPEGYVAKQVPGAMGSMMTVYENPQTGETMVPDVKQEAQQAIMDRRGEADQTFNNLVFPTGAGVFYGASNIAQGNYGQGALELAGTLPIPFLKGSKGSKTKQLPGSPNLDIMSLSAPKGNMYGENQVLVQQSRLLNPKIKAKFFKNQAPEVEVMPGKLQKTPKDYGNRITPENYEDFVNRIHGSTDYDFAQLPKTGANLGIGSYGKPGMVYKDAPLNKLGKDIVNAHEKNHGIFAGTISKEMEAALLKPFGTNKPIPHYQGKHQADEVLARMGQFKNAFGMGDDQIFTLGHLNLIRKNYANRFLDNGITAMLSKIKPGSLGEKEFLINMNKYAFGLTSAAIGTGAAAVMSEDGTPQQKYGGWLQKYQDGANLGEGFKKRLMKRNPGMQNVYGPEGENLNIIKDPNFDARSYGYGDIEFMAPGLEQINYDNIIDNTLPGYTYVNPTPDKYTSVYNPKGANRGDVFLDMLHGMRNDPNYELLVQNFDKATRDARGSDMEYYYNYDVANGYSDGQEWWDKNYIDGQLRAQLAQGTLGMFSHGRRDYRKERKSASPEMRAAAKDIRKYIKGKYEDGGTFHKNQYINSVTLSNTSSWLNKYK